MKTNQHTNCIWHDRTLVTAMVLVMACVGIGAAPNDTVTKSEAVDQASSPDAYKHFLYIRHDLEGSFAKSDSLVLVRVTPEGFKSRVVYSEMNLNIDWHPLGVCNRKLYGIKMGLLISVDLETGSAMEVDSGIESWKWSDRKLYAFIPKSPSSQASLLRVYDTETETCRDIGVPPHPPEGILWESWPPKLQVSPDHKGLAYFLRSTNLMNSYIHQLCLVAVDDGTVKTSKMSVAAREFLTGGSAGMVSEGPPFCWLDSKTLLIVRDISTNHSSDSWSPGDADMILSRVDVDADRITDICPLPRFKPLMGEPFFRVRQKGEVPRLVIGRLGQYRIDLAEGRVRKDSDLGGGFNYTRGNSAEEADELRFKDTLLEDGTVIQEIAASPDGRQVAWDARPLVPPRWDEDARVKIRFYDTVSGQTRTVAPEWIPDALQFGRPSFEGNLLWISARDLTPRTQTNAPAGWTRFSPQPYLGGGRSNRTAR